MRRGGVRREEEGVRREGEGVRRERGRCEERGGCEKRGEDVRGEGEGEAVRVIPSRNQDHRHTPSHGTNTHHLRD